MTIDEALKILNDWASKVLNQHVCKVEQGIATCSDGVDYWQSRGIKSESELIKAQARIKYLEDALSKTQEAIVNPACDHCETVHKRINPSCCEKVEARISELESILKSKDSALRNSPHDSGCNTFNGARSDEKNCEICQALAIRPKGDKT